MSRQQLTFYEKRLRRLCHKLSRQIEGSANRAETIVKIQKTHEKLARALPGASLSEFHQRMLKRAKQLGVVIVVADRFCLESEDGVKDATHKCTTCDLELDRDRDAATKLIQK